MVDRREIDSLTPCTVIDLDGTYIDGNTLKIYLACGLRYLSSHFKIKQLSRLLLAVAKRKAGLSSHKEMKRVILSTLYAYPEILYTFKDAANLKINPLVKDLISHHQRFGRRILLATAAPEFYVSTVWHGDFVATQFQPNKPLTECLGVEKLRRVKQWLDDNGCRLVCVVTDHKDDAPLLHFNSDGQNILVNPSASTLRFFRELKPTHFLLIEELGDFGIAK